MFTSLIIGVVVGLGTKNFYLGIAAVLVSDILDDIKILLSDIKRKMSK